MSTGTYTDKLYKFLESNRVKKVDGDEKSSHYSMGTPVGSFYISGVKRDRLNRLTARALGEGTTLHLLEKPRGQGPIIFDIDIKYHSDNNTRRYTYDHILKTVEIYNSVINKYLNIDPEHGHCFITEKKYPNKTNEMIYKDGFHGEYPNIVASIDMKYIIHREVVDEFEKSDYYNNINPLNKYCDIFDEMIIRDTNWFLYGCCKPQREPYLLTHVIGSDLQEYNYKNKFTLENLPSILSIRQFGTEDLTMYNDNITDDIVKDKFAKLNIKKKKVHTTRKRSREYTEEDIEYAQKLVKLLSVDRADSFQTWTEVGWALYNIDDLLVDNFIEFSQISSKFRFGECEKLWDKMRNEGTRGVGLGSLIKWAENDNPEEFKKLRSDAEINIIKRSISGTSGDVARSFFHINKGKFKCASIKNSAWYEFKNHRWQPIDSAKTIMLMLNDDYPLKYKKVADMFYYRSQQLEGEEKKLFEIKREAALKTAEKLTTVKFKKDVIEELKHRFHDDEFYNKLDENRYLICCKNGIYDFKNNIFREGYPDDYLSLCTNLDYIVYDKDDEKIKQIENFFSEVQPDEGMYNYILDYFASCLVGHSPDEFFHIWTGSGGNAKSVSIGLFQSIIGDYATTISITLLTKSRAASNAASPEMANCKGKRFVVFQEPENDDKIHVGHMKELTGNDKISARALFKEPIEFYPQFKTILTCNKLPYIPSNDGGTWRRLRVAPFEMKFVNEPKEPNERKKDRYLKDKMETWKTPLLYMLINRYVTRLRVEGLREPDKVKEFTNEYQRQSDIYYEYLSEQLEITTNKKDTINLTTMYNDFKMWAKEAHTERRMPPRCEFKDNIEEKIGKMRSNKWRSIRFCLDKNNSDDTDSDSEDEKKQILFK
jgi:P4 family phage/plasmid primase-like protien